ncbi:nuclear receptor family 2 group C protein [Thalictrum thalictroides]|uniref:Nuclear receptor family 2 group C protein n=1 Tax=Thalictrum thalictroides TaxID=46969 RepID=A0A7J6XF26_THATH|nr:nuclear receptor family 2 group C protein [Thalictrum thalictroides]
MGKKRKSETSALNEIDRSIYSSFSSAASSLSQLYSQSVNQHKLAFQAGERHALEKLYEWMTAKEQEGAGLSEADVYTYLQSYPHCIAAGTEGGSPVEQSDKKSTSPIHQENGEDHPKATANPVCPLESDMDIS